MHHLKYAKMSRTGQFHDFVFSEYVLLMLFFIVTMRTRTDLPPKKKAPMTSSGRDRVRRKGSIALEREREKTRERVKDIRRKKNEVEGRETCSRTCKDPSCMLQPERDRKRLYRGSIRGSDRKTDKRITEGLKWRRVNADEKVQTIKKLQVSVRGLMNENRRLKRRGILERRQI